MPGSQIRSPTPFNLTNGQQTIPVFAPEGTEITTTIQAINGIVQGAVSVDYTNSADALVANGTAAWVNAAQVYNTAGIFTLKVYTDCWVRFNGTGGFAYVLVNPAGSSITPTNDPFEPYINEGVIPPPAPPFIISATPGLAVDNSPSWASQIAEGGSLVPQTVTARISAPGDYLFNALNDIFPSMSPVMFGRGAIRLVPGANLPATTSAPGPGAPAAMFRVLARTPTNPDVQAYETDIGGFNMDGSGVSQINTVHGIRFPNPNPGSNPFDPDPNFTTNKDYTAAYVHDIDITNFSGDGINVEGGRGRLHIFSVRCLNCLGNGFTLGGNDKIFDGHWAGGGCGNPATGTGWSVLAGEASGFYGVTGNVWSNQNSQSATSGAMFFRAAKLAILAVTELNSWCRFDGGSNYFEPITFIGNMFHLHGVNFTSDGVGVNVLNDGDSRVNACTGWLEYTAGSMLWNKYARTDAVGFATPGNFGGFIDGSVGTAVQYLHDVSTNGHNPCLLNVAEDYSTAPDAKPWTDLQHTVTVISNDGKGNLLLQANGHNLQTNDVVGFYTSNTLVVPGITPTTNTYYVLRVDGNHYSISVNPIWNSTPSLVAYSAPTGSGTLTYTSLSTPPYIQNHGNLVNYQYMDAYRALLRVGAITPNAPPVDGSYPRIGTHSHIALGIAETDDINPIYFIEAGDRTSAARNILYGQWELYSALQYTDFAWGATSTVAADTKNLPPYEPYHFFSTSGAGIANYGIEIATDLNATYSSEMVFSGGPITGLVFGVQGGGSIDTAGITPPTSSPGQMILRTTYRRDTNKVRITGVAAGAAGMPMGRLDGNTVETGVIGETSQRNFNVYSTTALTNNASANINQITLQPGTYLVVGYAGFTAPTTALVTSAQWALSLTSATLPGTKDESYGGQQYGLSGLSMSSIFQTGAVFMIAHVTVATPLYLVGQANFSSGTVSAGGTILPLRIG